MPMQSPIDITRRALVPLGPRPALRFRYPSSPVAVSVRFEVKDGDPVRGRPQAAPQLVVVPQEGEARVEIGADTYLLQSLHWHTPSEHHLEGRPLPLELHLVHRRAADGALLVAGVLYRAGAHSRAIAPAFDLIGRFDPAALAPDRPQEAAASMHLGHLLPEARTTYRYPGSLTTAPFTTASKPVSRVPLGLSRAILSSRKRVSSTLDTCLVASRPASSFRLAFNIYGRREEACRPWHRSVLD